MGRYVGPQGPFSQGPGMTKLTSLSRGTPNQRKNIKSDLNGPCTHPLPVPEEGEPGWVLAATCEGVGGCGAVHG